MSSLVKLFSITLALLIVNNLQVLQAQDKLAWLNDYTAEIPIGNDTYQYDFTNVDGNDCKIKIEEQITDKKGGTEKRAWIFYLSDMDPSKLSFKAKGKSLVISMETNQSQKFITYFEEGEIDGYTHEIQLSMNEIDMARTFLETLKQKVGNCENTQTLWENRDEAFSWLENNIGKASNKDVQWDQKFKPGIRNYLVDFEANSVNGKGEQSLSEYVFDLTDIDPLKLNLKISGTSLMLEIPVKDGKRFISVKTPSGTKFTDELLIYSESIESARQTFNALKYVISSTSYERTQWDSYQSSMEFVKDHLGEVQIGDGKITNSLSFEPAPFGLVEFTISTQESEDSPEAVNYAFYLTDLADKLALEVSKSITLEMVTNEKHEFIRVSKDGKVTDYAANLSFNMASIDMARDMISAFEYAIKNSQEKIEEFSKISETSAWISEHIGAVEMDGSTYLQNMSIDQEYGNQITIDTKLEKEDGSGTETKSILYPMDISLDNLDIKTSGRKLFVSLTTGSDKYIKNIEGNIIQDFTSGIEVLFSDPLDAKNFMAAIRFIKEKSEIEVEADMSKEDAMAFLSDHNQTLKLPSEHYEQKMETVEEENCKMSFTRVELDDKKPSIEYLYEFSASDINPAASNLSVKGEIVSINLETTGNEKLIKPYENGEADDFVAGFVIYSDDVLVAKKTLAAFATLSEACK